jgi:hypothetical protein
MTRNLNKPPALLQAILNNNWLLRVGGAGQPWKAGALKHARNGKVLRVSSIHRLNNRRRWKQTNVSFELQNGCQQLPHCAG